jgi:hypothetical protein
VLHAGSSGGTGVALAARFVAGGFCTGQHSKSKSFLHSSSGTCSSFARLSWLFQQVDIEVYLPVGPSRTLQTVAVDSNNPEAVLLVKLEDYFVAHQRW